MWRHARHSVGLAVIAAGLLASSAGARAGQAEQTAEQAFRNIQALNGTPAAQLNQAMHLMNAALTVTCEHCHIEGEWDKDVKAPKLVARGMVRMMRELNERQFGGAQVVTCFTCHQGNRIPVNAPRLPVPEPRVEAAAAALPTVDDILSRYVAALGGTSAIERVSTRVINGTQEIPTGPGGRVLMPAVVQRFIKAPDRHVTTYRTATFTIVEGFDGTRAWRQDQNGRVTNLAPLDARRAQRQSDLHAALHLRRHYPRLEVRGVERVNGRNAYVLEGYPEGDRAEQLYFDAETGLLLRTRTVVPTPVGDSPQEIAFDDYRDAGRGMKMPFAVTLSPAGARTVLFPVATLKVTKVEENVPIDDARFAAPVSRASQ